jgi:hypothetical protein
LIGLDSKIAKYNYNGEIDITFGENGFVHLLDNETYNITPLCIKILNDRSIFVAGYDKFNYRDKELAFCKLTFDGSVKLILI